MIWLVILALVAVVAFLAYLIVKQPGVGALDDDGLDDDEEPPVVVDVCLHELSALQADQAADRIAQIVAANEEAAKRTAGMSGLDGISLFPAPTWRAGAKGRIEQSMTLLPTLFRSHYYDRKILGRLRSNEVRRVLGDAAVGAAERAGTVLPILEEIAEMYEGDVDDAPGLGDLDDYQEGDRPLTLLVADAARCLSAGADAKELRARYGLADEPEVLDSLYEKLGEITSRELKAYLGSMDVEV